MKKPGAGEVVVARINSAHGVRGWVKVTSFTSPPDGLFQYSDISIGAGAERRSAKIEAGRWQGKGLVLKLAGCDDRDAAESLRGAEISVSREQFPELSPGEYYWTDLEGLAVETTEGVKLGRVDSLLETGANDVLVIEGDRRRLVPYVPEAVVKNVNLADGLMVVDWDPDF